MSFFKSIGNAIFREYDRRIKRASLITEYGAHHHAHADHGEHADETHTDATNVDAQVEESPAEEAEIANVPRGTPVSAAKPVEE